MTTTLRNIPYPVALGGTGIATPPSGGGGNLLLGAPPNYAPGTMTEGNFGIRVSYTGGNIVLDNNIVSYFQGLIIPTSTGVTTIVNYSDPVFNFQPMYVFLLGFDIVPGGGSIQPEISIGTSAPYTNIVDTVALGMTADSQVQQFGIANGAPWIPNTGGSISLNVSTATDFTTYSFNIFLFGLLFE